jgi:cytochrome b6-f complex iron-sulfur subunit
LTADPTTPSTETPQPERSRRDMLCGLAVALVAPGALIAACSDSGGGTDTSGGSGDSGGDQGGSGGGSTALADIPDGGGLIVDNPGGGKALLVRKGQEVTAYDAACTHMGTIVNAPKKNGVALCPNHGSKFDVAAGGKVTNGPATKPLKKLDVQVQGDKVTMA